MSSGFSTRQAEAVADSDCRVVVWDGAVRSGKTFAWIFLLLWKVAAHRGVDWFHSHTQNLGWACGCLGMQKPRHVTIVTGLANRLDSGHWA